MKRSFSSYPLAVGLLLLCNLGCESEKPKGFASSGRGDTPRQMSLLTIQGNTVANWKKDSSNNVYVNSKTIVLGGSCVAIGRFLVYSQNKVVGSPAVCDKDSNFLWSYTVPADGSISFQFKASDNAVLNSVNLVVDTIAPAAPIILTNNGLDFSATSPNQTLQGTTSGDTTQVISNDPLGKITFSGTQFTLDTIVNISIAKSIAIYALDFTGNQSPPATITIRPRNALLPSAGFSGAGLPSGTLGSQGLAKMEVTIAPFITTSTNNVSSPGALKLNTGIIQVSEDGAGP